MSLPIKRDQDGRAYVRVGRKVADLIAGEVDLGDWSDEEILRGQARAKDGSFKGQPPALVPREIYQEWSRRQLESGFAELISNLPELLKAVVAIANDDTLDPNVRLKATDIALDRILGKPREKVDLGLEVTGTLKHEQIIDEVTIRRDEFSEPWDEITDAEVVDDEDDWDDPEEWMD